MKNMVLKKLYIRPERTILLWNAFNMVKGQPWYTLRYVFITGHINRASKLIRTSKQSLSSGWTLYGTRRELACRAYQISIQRTSLDEQPQKMTLYYGRGSFCLYSTVFYDCIQFILLSKKKSLFYCLVLRPRFSFYGRVAGSSQYLSFLGGAFSSTSWAFCSFVLEI